MQFIQILLNKKKKTKLVLVLFQVILLLGLMSCNMYSNDEIIEYGKTTLESNEKEFKKIIDYSNELVSDSCTRYKMFTSVATDAIRLSEIVYNETQNKISEGSYVEMKLKDNDYIRNTLPKKEASTYIFVKNVYFSFRLNKCRNHKERQAKLMYCYDKKIFMKLFSNYSFYDKNTLKGDVPDGEKWIYFYNAHWAITTSSSYYRKTEEECKKIIKL